MANPVKKKLVDGDITTKLGELLKQVPSSTEFTVKQSGTKTNPNKHTITISFDIVPEQLFDPKAPHIKDDEAYAVINSKITDGEVSDLRLAFTVLKEEAVDNYALKINLSGVIPGDKGKHGN